MYWVGIRDKAVWLTLFDMITMISSYLIGGIYMHCEGLFDQSFCWVADKSRYGAAYFSIFILHLNRWIEVYYRAFFPAFVMVLGWIGCLGHQ